MKNLSNAKIFHSCHYKNKDTTKKSLFQIENQLVPKVILRFENDIIDFLAHELWYAIISLCNGWKPPKK